METAGFLRSRSALVACCARQSWLAMAQASASVRQERDLVQEAVQTGAWQVPPVPQKRRETPHGHSDYLRLYTDLTSSRVVHELSGFNAFHVCKMQDVEWM